MNIQVKDDGRFQGKVYFEKVISINEDEQITSGIPISCGPGDFTVTSEFEIEDAEYTNETLQKQIVAAKASFKLFDRKWHHLIFRSGCLERHLSAKRIVIGNRYQAVVALGEDLNDHLMLKIR